MKPQHHISKFFIILTALIFLSANTQALVPSLLAQEFVTEETAIIQENVSTHDGMESDSINGEIEGEDNVSGTGVIPAISEEGNAEGETTEVMDVIPEPNNSDGEVFENLGKSAKKSFVKAKREWTDDEIIALGYIPDEVVVKFKEDRMNLKTSEGRDKAKSFAERKSADLGNKIFNA